MNKGKSTKNGAKISSSSTDKNKYRKYCTSLPIGFSQANLKNAQESFYMAEDEFRILRPRLIHTEIIGWNPIEETERSKPICVCLYITDGTRTVDIEKGTTEPTAYSYFVRLGDRTWKPYNLPTCFQIINGVRLFGIKDVTEEIALDKKREKQEAGKAAKKQSKSQ